MCVCVCVPLCADKGNSLTQGDADLSRVLQEGVKGTERPGAEGYSFPALFGAAMTLGALSR